MGVIRNQICYGEHRGVVISFKCPSTKIDIPDLGDKDMCANTISNAPALHPSMVCYADILGFRKRVDTAFNSGKQEDFLSEVKDAIDAAYEEILDEAIPRESGYASQKILDIKLFSDNILVDYPLYDRDRDYGEPELGALLDLFSHALARPT